MDGPRTPTTSAPQTNTPSNSTDLSTLTIRPGEIGAARVGMTRAEWTKTGLFEEGPAVCAGELIHWASKNPAKPVEDGFDAASVYPPGEEDGGVSIAFLLDAPVGKVTDATKIARIAVSGGEKPDFQYDCGAVEQARIAFGL